MQQKRLQDDFDLEAGELIRQYEDRMLDFKSKHTAEAAKVEGFKLQNSELRQTVTKLQQQLQQVDADD